MRDDVRVKALIRYPRVMRVLHWTRDAVIIGTLSAGLLMVNLPDELPVKFETFYPRHKQFGVLALTLVLAQLVARGQNRLPGPPQTLHPWEQRLSVITHKALYVLMIMVPLMGYSISSTFTQSDGVLFFIGSLSELLAKNDQAFKVFQWLHKLSAYALLMLIVLHVAGALKHRSTDRSAEADVMRRMW